MHQAQVSYQLGQLTVLAENSSLDQILHGVASQTGMKITGSVADEHVYGTYGPAAPAKVLAQLLEGSGNNMILRESAANDPLELVLTPTQGMPSMSSTPAYNPQQYVSQPVYQPPQTFSPQPAPPQYPAQPQQVYGGPGGVSQPVGTSQPAEISRPVPSADPQSQPQSSVPQSPNGVATPQQIFEQLQRLQQQKAQAPAPSQ